MFCHPVFAFSLDIARARSVVDATSKKDVTVIVTASLCLTSRCNATGSPEG